MRSTGGEKLRAMLADCKQEAGKEAIKGCVSDAGRMD
jgi:hypothetical protein